MQPLHRPSGGAATADARAHSAAVSSPTHCSPTLVSPSRSICCMPAKVFPRSRQKRSMVSQSDGPVSQKASQATGSFKKNVISFLLADSAFLVANQCGVAQMKVEYLTKCCSLMESCSLCPNSHNSNLKKGKNHCISSTVAKY